MYSLDTSWPAPNAFSAYPGIDSITAITVLYTGGKKEIHVAQRNTSYPFVLVLSDSGEVTRTWGGKIKSPHGLQGQGNSSVWVVDIAGYVATQFDLNGAVLRQAGTGKAGNSVSPPEFSAPADVAFTSTGAIAISDGDGGSNNRVLVLDSANLTHTLFTIGSTGTAPDKFSSPHSITYEAATDRLWVADRGNSRLTAFSAQNGTLVGSWIASACFPGGAPWGVRIDEARGHMIVPDGNVGALYILAMPPAGSGGVGPCKLLQNITIGLLEKPHLVALDAGSGDVYVANVGVPTSAQRYKLA